MKIALPSVNDVVDGNFGHRESFAVFTIDENKRIVKEERITPPPGCGCKSDIVQQQKARLRAPAQCRPSQEARKEGRFSRHQSLPARRPFWSQ